jgi:hypothetical protein
MEGDLRAQLDAINADDQKCHGMPLIQQSATYHEQGTFGAACMRDFLSLRRNYYVIVGVSGLATSASSTTHRQIVSLQCVLSGSHLRAVVLSDENAPSFQEGTVLSDTLAVRNDGDLVCSMVIPGVALPLSKYTSPSAPFSTPLLPSRTHTMSGYGRTLCAAAARTAAASNDVASAASAAGGSTAANSTTLADIPQEVVYQKVPKFVRDGLESRAQQPSVEDGITVHWNEAKQMYVPAEGTAVE